MTMTARDAFIIDEDFVDVCDGSKEMPNACSSTRTRHLVLRVDWEIKRGDVSINLDIVLMTCQ
jgi:hypothetical protein